MMINVSDLVMIYIPSIAKFATFRSYVHWGPDHSLASLASFLDRRTLVRDSAGQQLRDVTNYVTLSSLYCAECVMSECEPQLNNLFSHSFLCTVDLQQIVACHLQWKLFTETWR